MCRFACFTFLLPLVTLPAYADIHTASNTRFNTHASAPADTQQRHASTKIRQAMSGSSVDQLARKREAFIATLDKMIVMVQSQFPLRVDHVSHITKVERQGDLVLYHFDLYMNQAVPAKRRSDRKQWVEVRMKAASKTSTCSQFKDAWSFYPELKIRYVHQFPDEPQSYSFDISKSDCT